MTLENLDSQDREVLARKFIEEVILKQWDQLGEWKALTNQSDQIDFGYLSQHLVSLLTGISGNGQRGKGDDLNDGSEIKSASCLGATDAPRWNNVNCGSKTKEELINVLSNTPYMFFVLFDTTKKDGDTLRCRMWAVRPSEDEEFRKVLLKWGNKLTGTPKNLQLHPPRWEKGTANITTNECGNLKLPLIYHAEQVKIPEILVMKTVSYDPDKIQTGLCEAVERDQ